MSKLEDILKGFEPTLTEDYHPSSVECKFITGAAGTGKTYGVKQRTETTPGWGVLCATTGIAAVNLGASTLNSTLKFFDTESLRDNFNRGRLTAILHKIGRSVRVLVIDEVSMMDGKQLDYIFQAMLQVNDFKDMADRPMGITLTGDFAQLPPVKSSWAFEAECWEHFERNTEKLEKVWRQENLEFLAAINAARSGKGKECAGILQGLGVRFLPQASGRFQGTTILSKNDMVDNFNYSALLDLPGEAFGLKTETWGQQSGEWKNIPEVLKLKDKAYVMILSNSSAASEYSYANGDCGYVQSHDADGTVWVKLVRNDLVVPIWPVTRYKTARDEEADKFGVDRTYGKYRHLYCSKDCGGDDPGLRQGPWGEFSYNCTGDSYNVGAIKYYPLRLAYATTVHKSQGLTLDRCQIDCRDKFFGSPSMAYVALSRCRSHEGLSIVGTPEILADRICIEPKVRRWL